MAPIQMSRSDVVMWLMDGFGQWFNDLHAEWAHSLTREDLQDLDSRITDAIMTIIIEYAAENNVFQETK